MTENKSTATFIPLLDFNDPVLIALDKKIRTLLDEKPSSLNRELQIRTLVYVNFNKYLTLLLIKAGIAITEEVLEKLAETPNNKRLELVTGAIKQDSEQIINNFIKIWEF